MSQPATNSSHISKLDEYDDEDIGDVVMKLSKSFRIEFTRDAFLNVKTFGDMLDVFDQHISTDHHEDCTKQQAFYKIRQAISKTQGIDERDIKLDSNLEFLFPRNARRKKARVFQSHLGIKFDMLKYPDWLAWTLGIGFLLSLIAFFFDWKIALSGIGFFIVVMKIADKLVKELGLKTVRDLTEKLSKENYAGIRRRKGTVNRNEITSVITETFSKDLDIDVTLLTRDAKFSWA